MRPRLNVALVLEDARHEGDGAGGYRTQWLALGVVYAAMQALRGAKRAGAVGPRSRVDWRITVRGAPPGDPRRPVAGQRLRLGARVLRIEAVAEADPAGRFLEIQAKEEAVA